ncbi:decapping and exoribonuclease protein [Aphomia sociella]
MQSQLLTDPNIYRKPFPHFGRPKIIGYIGLENLHFAKYLLEGNVQFDLNHCLDQAIYRPPDLDVKLTELLSFLKENEARLNLPLENTLEKANFYCYRGLMTCIACTPYENNEAWKIAVILYKGNIYLCARDTEEKLRRKRNMTAQEKQFTSWGYKFEQFLLSDRPDTDPTPNVPVDENKEFSLIFKTYLNRHKIIYGAEMDGIRCDGEPMECPPISDGPEAVIQYLSTKEFVELKTSRHIEYKKQDKSFRRYKTKKWWCQSFLVGIETILCGFRNDYGIVEELRTYRTKDLKKMSEQYWDANACFNFLDDFFTYVKRCLAREIRLKHGDEAVNKLQTLPMITLLLEWSPRSPVRVAENYSYEDDPILPEWFLNSTRNSNM